MKANYEIETLKKMLALENEQRVKGLRAELCYYTSEKYHVNLDEEDLQVLIDHYERKRQPERPTKEDRLNTTDLQRMIIALIAYSAELSVKEKKPEIAAEVDRLVDTVAQWNWLVSEANDWAVDITVKG